jgi:hypothetical protein
LITIGWIILRVRQRAQISLFKKPGYILLCRSSTNSAALARRRVLIGSFVYLMGLIKRLIALLRAIQLDFTK